MNLPRPFAVCPTLAILLSFSLIGCNRSDSPSGSPQANIDPALLEKLAEEQEFAGYYVRPPKEYTLLKQTYGGTKAFIWNGPRRPDGSVPKFWLMVGELTPEEAKQPLEKSAAIIQGGAKQKLDDYRESTSERVTINGFEFLRFSFQGNEKGPLNFKGNSIVYHGHDGPKYIHIMAMDVEPHHTETQPLLEAAAKTLRKGK